MFVCLQASHPGDTEGQELGSRDPESVRFDVPLCQRRFLQVRLSKFLAVKGMSEAFFWGLLHLGTLAWIWSQAVPALLRFLEVQEAVGTGKVDESRGRAGLQPPEVCSNRL